MRPGRSDNRTGAWDGCGDVAAEDKSRTPMPKRTRRPRRLNYSTPQELQKQLQLRTS